LALELFQLKVTGCSPPEKVAALPFSLTGDGDRVAGPRINPYGFTWVSMVIDDPAWAMRA